MTFLDPVAGLIAAGVSVPAVLLLYFLKLRRQPLRVSSTLLWERAVHDVQVNAPFRWLRLSWLLLLQLLIALLLSGAIGRPALRGAAVTSGRIVIVIDHSASMNALDGVLEGASRGAQVSRLEQARADALELIRRLRRGDGGVQIAVAAWSAQARRLTSFTGDDTALREAVLGIPPTDQPAGVAELVRLIEALGAASTDERAAAERTRVFLLSDGGNFDEEGAGLIINAPVDVTYVRIGRPAPPPPRSPSSPAATTPAAASPQELAASGAASPGAPDQAVATPGKPAQRNLGIVAISARRDHEDPTLTRIFVRVINAGTTAQRATLQLLVDGSVERVATVGLGPAGEDAPGEAAHTFDLVSLRGGTVAVTIAGADDLLAADDGAAVVLKPPRRPQVLVVAPGTGGAEADQFLMEALRVLRLEVVRTADQAEYERLLGAGGVERYDLVIFDRVSAPPPLKPSIHLGADPQVPGVSVAPVARPAAEGPNEAARGVWTRVLMWERTHPVMRYVSLDNLVVAPPLRLTLPPPAPDSPIRSTVLATGTLGPLMAMVEDRGMERLLLAFEMARTNWGPEASWLIFLSNAVDVLTMRSEAMMGRSHTTAEPVRVVAAPLPREAGRITLSGPADLSFPISEEQRGEAVSLGLIELAGVYSVAGAADVQTLAVNLVDEEESRLLVRPSIRIGGKAATGRGVGEATPREIWHWFVLAAVGLLGIEWLLYAWRMRL